MVSKVVENHSFQKRVNNKWEFVVQNNKVHKEHPVHILIAYSATPRIVAYMKNSLEQYLDKEDRPFLIEREDNKGNSTMVPYYLKAVEFSREKEHHQLVRGYILIETKGYFGEGVNIVAKLSDLVDQFSTYLNDSIEIACDGEWSEDDLNYEIHVQARAMSQMARTCMRDKIVHQYYSDLLVCLVKASTVTKNHEYMAAIQIPDADKVNAFMCYSVKE